MKKAALTKFETDKIVDLHKYTDFNIIKFNKRSK